MSDTKTKERVDPKLVSTFVNSAHNVMSTMVNIDFEVGKPELKHDPKPAFDVSGIIGFSGEVIGSVVVSFTEETAKEIVKAFTMEEMDIHDEDFADAIGELCNMIAGNAKKDFGLEANITTPNVIVGKGHSISRLSYVPCVIIPCSCEAGPFAVEVNIKQVTPVNV
jgi:chemotaxis protein CheX